MRSLLLAVLVALAIGCDGDAAKKSDGGIAPTDDSSTGSDGSQQSQDFALAVDPTSLTIPIGSSGTVNVNITRTNFDDTITLAASNLPTGVTVSFNPSTLGAGVNTSVATISGGPGATAGTSTLTMAGTAGVVEHSATVSLTTTTITVAGSVSSGSTGITVVLVGKSSTTTGSGGTFTFTDVTPPYDLYTVGTDFSNTKWIYYYKGLTRPDPIVTHATSFIVAGTASTSTVGGTLSGGIGALNRRVLWGDTSGSVIPTSTAYSFTASWPTAANKSGTMHAIEWTTNSNGTPETIVYGSTNATVSAGGTDDNMINVAMATPTTAIITGTLTAPAGFLGLIETFFTQQFGSNSVQMAQGFSGTLDCKIPVIAAGKQTLYAEITDGSGNDMQKSYFVHPAIDSNTDATYQMALPAQLTAPANAATGVGLTTDFTVTSPTTTVNRFNISTSGTTKVGYSIFTTDTTARIPNVAEAALPAGQSFSWNVTTFAPHTHVNGVAVAKATDFPSKTEFVGTKRTYTTSKTRTFTSP